MDRFERKVRYIYIGRRLRARRMELGLDIETLAERTGLDGGFLRNLERGDTSKNLTEVIGMAAELDLSLDELFGSDPDEEMLAEICDELICEIGP